MKPAVTDADLEKLVQLGRHLVVGVKADVAEPFLREIGPGLLKYTARAKAGDQTAPRVLRHLYSQASASATLAQIHAENAAFNAATFIINWAANALAVAL